MSGQSKHPASPAKPAGPPFPINYLIASCLACGMENAIRKPLPVLLGASAIGYSIFSGIVDAKHALLAAVSVLVYRIFSRREWIHTMGRIISGEAFSQPGASFQFCLEKYNDKWPGEVEREMKRIFEASKAKYPSHNSGKPHFFGHPVDVSLCPGGFSHIGSTSIKGIELSTPAHDVAIAIEGRLSPQLKEDLRSLGYVFIGRPPHNHFGDYWFFCVVPEEERETRGHGFDIHLIESQEKSARRWLERVMRFRDYLTAHLPARAEYVACKKPFVGTDDLVTYKRTKSMTVYKLLEQADEWAKNKKDD